MKAYKGFNSDLTCRGFQYKEGETFTHDGDVALCESGFHACTNPIDTLHYYSPAEGSRYFEVECDGVSQEKSEDSKIVCSKLTVGAELDVLSMVKIGVQMIFDRVKKAKFDKATSGYQSTAATSGDLSTAATSGDRSTAATSGYRSTAIAYGKDSIAVANGYQAKAKGVLGSYIAITEYDDNDNLLRFKCHKVDGKTVKPNTFYMLKNGRFVEVKG